MTDNKLAKFREKVLSSGSDTGKVREQRSFNLSNPPNVRHSDYELEVRSHLPPRMRKGESHGHVCISFNSDKIFFRPENDHFLKFSSVYMHVHKRFVPPRVEKERRNSDSSNLFVPPGNFMDAQMFGMGLMYQQYLQMCYQYQTYNQADADQENSIENDDVFSPCSPVGNNIQTS